MAYRVWYWKAVIPTDKHLGDLDQVVRPFIRATTAELLGVETWRVYVESGEATEPLTPEELKILQDRYPDDPSFQ